MNGISSIDFLKILKVESGSIAICKPTKGKIYKHLLASAKTDENRTRYWALCVVDLIMKRRKAIRLAEQIFRNAAAITALHKSFRVVFSEHDLGTDVNGIPIENGMRNKFSISIEGYATD